MSITDEVDEELLLTSIIIMEEVEKNIISVGLA